MTPTVLPMFPLGNVVFPFTAIPLRVFEDRYQALLDSVLDGDGRFGIVLIERGFEVGGGDERFRTGTMVEVVGVSDLPDGSRAVVVAGLERLRVEDWLPDDPFPRGLVSTWADNDSSTDLSVDLVQSRLVRVLALASELGSNVAGLDVEVADDLLAASYQLAALTPVTPIDSYRLLETEGPAERLELTYEMLQGQAELFLGQLEAGGPEG